MASAGKERASRPVPTSLSVQLRMERQPSRDTRIELAFRKMLHGRGLRFRVHRRPLAGLRRTADIVFARKRVAAFVDGCFWHGCDAHFMKPVSNADYWMPKIEANKRRDADTDARLASCGWVSFRVW